jgi:S-(hydroxymethyl)glutathione dehydrogenase/alcohol dehydrogenase
MPLHFGKQLTGSHGGDARPDVDIPRLVRLQQAGRFDLSRLVSHTLRLDQVNEAIDLMRRGEALRCVLRMDE